MGLLDGNVAVVTGAGQGIGKGVARRLVLEGAKVVVAELNEQQGEQTAVELRELGGDAVFVKTDVSKKADVENMIAAAVKSYGRLDILVNNACRAPAQLLFEEKTDAMLEEQLAIGVWGSWWAMRAAMPIMRQQGGGRIINFVSIDVDTGAWLHADYAIAKAGVQAMTRSAATDWGRYNITVNCIAPTAATEPFVEMCKHRPELEKMAALSRPIERMGHPENDIAPAVVMLASDAGRYMTGITLPVDGGKHMARGMNRPPEEFFEARASK